MVKATLLRTSALRSWILFLKNVEVYIHIFSGGQDKILLVGLPNFNIVIKKTHTLFSTCQMKSDIPVDAFFSFLFFCCFLPSKNLLIICFPSFCPTEFLSCCFDSLRFFPDKFFFQFVIVPSSLTQLPMLLLAYRTTRFMSRCVLPIIFSILCPWQGKGLPLSDGKREGRACQRCDLNWCSHLEGVRATARNTQVSSASDMCPVL